MQNEARTLYGTKI